MAIFKKYGFDAKTWKSSALAARIASDGSPEALNAAILSFPRRRLRGIEVHFVYIWAAVRLETASQLGHFPNSDARLAVAPRASRPRCFRSDWLPRGLRSVRSGKGISTAHPFKTADAWPRLRHASSLDIWHAGKVRSFATAPADPGSEEILYRECRDHEARN